MKINMCLREDYNKNKLKECGFIMCKKPFNTLYYRCFAQDSKIILINEFGCWIVDWFKTDPRIYTVAGIKHQSSHSSLSGIYELVEKGLLKEISGE